MLKRVRQLVTFAWFTVVLFSSTSVHAASLEKIEVASHLGEAFYAEVPLELEANESVSRLFVEIAAPADYKVFEVYREPVLGSIRADVVSDQRGIRVELSSRTAIKSPFFNLVLKVRYGRVAHFKKIPVFLEPPKNIQAVAEQAPQPVLDEPVVATEQISAEVNSQPVQAWARTDQYGPIVHGDALSTVANRLRIDKRYSSYQVMTALFEKNRNKFDKENMNLLKSGSLLEVPTAEEVEQRTADQAYKLFAKHEKEWKSLTSQPRYAAVAEAQRTRYSKRVRIGQQAGGSAGAPVLAPAVADQLKPDSTPASAAVTQAVVPDEPASAPESDFEAVDDSQKVAAETVIAPQLLKLQTENEALQQKLLENEQSIVALNNKMDEVASAASSARIEKLEVLLTRLQAELDRSNNRAQSLQGDADWVIPLLAVLIVVLLVIVVVLMRREPKHPAEHAVVTDQGAGAVAAATVAGAAAATVAQAETEDKTIEPDVFDSISSFADDLTDTDTAEMEPFDASALDEDPDPNVDYMSEADTYIRYGMDEEALHQLNLALRLDPAHTEAHLKKVSLLHGDDDGAAYNQAVEEAASALDADGLEEFHALTNRLNGTSIAEPVEEQPSGIVAEADEKKDTVDLKDNPIEDSIDFDLSDIEVPEQQDKSAESDGMLEMDWLHDDSFSESGSEEQQSAGLKNDLLEDNDLSASDEGATQMFGNLLDEFSEDESSSLSSDESSAENRLQPAEENFDGTIDLVASGATQGLGHLLSEFSEPDDAALVAPVESEQTMVIDEEMGATQHLDHLLDEFSDDDNMFDFGSEDAAVEDSVLTRAEAAVDKSEDASEFGATQHLDVLMNEFSEEKTAADQNLDGVNFELAESGADELADFSQDGDHGATQELDHLLNEFSAAEDSSAAIAASGSNPEGAHDIEMDHGATQELDQLLIGFAADDDGVKADQDAMQELDQLLGKFSNDDEDERKPKG